MKAIQLTAPSLTAFHRTELPDPKAGPGEVLVRLRAAALNFVDVAIATGKFPGPTFPMVPVADGAGEVAALGVGVDDMALGLAAGNRVIPHFMPNWQGGAITPRNVAAMRGITLPGSLADYVGCRHDGVECGALSHAAPGLGCRAAGNGRRQHFCAAVCQGVRRHGDHRVVVRRKAGTRARAGCRPSHQLSLHAGLG
jgi:threonine dehydrogenase-like Zn-dependent dehydrogenase